MNRPLWFDVLSTALFVKPQRNRKSIIIVPPHIFEPSTVPGCGCLYILTNKSFYNIPFLCESTFFKHFFWCAGLRAASIDSSPDDDKVV